MAATENEASEGAIQRSDSVVVLQGNEDLYFLHFFVCSIVNRGSENNITHRSFITTGSK